MVLFFQKREICIRSFPILFLLCFGESNFHNTFILKYFPFFQNILALVKSNGCPQIAITLLQSLHFSNCISELTALFLSVGHYASPFRYDLFITDISFPLWGAQKPSVSLPNMHRLRPSHRILADARTLKGKIRQYPRSIRQMAILVVTMVNRGTLWNSILLPAAGGNG